MLMSAWAGFYYGRRDCRDQPSGNAPAAQDSARRTATRLAPPIAGATYHGRNWPKNFINAFRREYVAGDFARLRAEGFNAVVLLVSWGDFQPVFEPCCRYDERAFERLVFLIEQARAAGLDVVLRIGYGWTFHPDAGDVGARVQRLLNDAQARNAFFAYAARVGAIAREHPNVRLILLSWEDMWLHRIDASGLPDFERYLASRADPATGSAAADPPIPTADGADAALFNGYWDWLLMQEIFKPTLQRLPELTFEARIDREPLWHVDAGGDKSVTWIGHESTYRPPGADVISLYWAPFWGARNQGEKLDAGQALQLFGSLLSEVHQHSAGLPMFIDQLNVIDNTLGFEHNATLQPSALPAFMDGALCTMRNAGVFGYAYWTTEDYAESPLYNPEFSYGLEGWTLATGDGKPPAQHLLAKASGDFDLRLGPGDRLQQTIPSRRGRLPGADPRFPAQVCVSTRSGGPATLEVTAGGGSIRIGVPAERPGRLCAPLATHPLDDSLKLDIHAVGGSVDLTGVMLFDHIQEGGMRRFDGGDGVLMPALRELNERFVDEKQAAALCGPQARGADSAGQVSSAR